MADDGEPDDDRANQDADVDADRARSGRVDMVERLLAAGTIRTDSVADAMTAIPRHRFIADSTIDAAYADDAVIVKRDHAGTAISSASQPTMVAAMLELCQLEPGHRVLEIGTGTGYNAALLAHLVGPDGLVVSIELEADLAEAARGRLGRLTRELDPPVGGLAGDLAGGLAEIVVVTGDAVVGHDTNVPYDRVIATTGAPGIAPAWIGQLCVGGRLVVPVVGADGIGSVTCQVKGPEGLTEVASLPCGFLPMRSA